MRVGVEGVGAIGPGIDGWHAAGRVLRGERAFDAAADLPAHAPAALPANERRRITPLIRMAMQCGEDALADARVSTRALRSVFSSSCGDLATVDRILDALTQPERPVSPTAFHNSVHNAPAGYWSIARADSAASISVSAHDASFSAGLLHAASYLSCGDGPVILVAYDCVAPRRLHPARPLQASFATALLLVDGPARWSLDIDVVDGRPANRMPDARLEALRAGNPAARSLPLLARLAGVGTGAVTLPYVGSLGIAVRIAT